MRILFITFKLNFETAGASVTELDVLARTLMGFGHEVKVVTVFSRANVIKEPLPYEVIEENIAASNQITLQWPVYGILKKYSDRADFFYIDAQNFLYAAGFYRKIGGRVPVAAFFNREMSCWPKNISTFFSRPKKGLFSGVRRKIRFGVEKYLAMPFANHIDIYTFVNPFLRRAYEDFGLKRKPSGDLIFGDPFDYKAFMKKYGVEEDSYAKRNKTAGPFTIFYSSRMAPGKGFDLLVKAFSEISNKENFRLILGGAGPEEKQVRQMISDLKLEKYVSLPGWVSKAEVYGTLKNADMFIQPRWRMDLTSYSLLEAMAFGLPCILPGGGGLEWDARGSALYFKDGDYKALAGRIEELGNNYSLRAELSRNCYARLKEDELDNEKQARRLAEEMERVRGGR